MNNFFKEHKYTLLSYIEKLKDSSIQDKDLLVKVVDGILKSNYNGFDICTFNIEHRGSAFINNLNDNIKEENIDWVISDLVRFYKEFEIKSDTLPNISAEFLTKYKKLESTNDQIYYAFNVMPLKIIEQQYSNKYLSFKEKLDLEISEIIDKKFPNKKADIDKLKKDNDNYVNLLKGFKQEFSFLALNQAFNKLEKSKQIARYVSLGLLFLLAVIIVYVPYFYYEKSFLIEQMSKVFNLTLNANNDSMPIFILFSGLIPMIFIESIFIYYFKIVLNKYNSITDQIVQLETKQAIMQFIESYVDYKKDKSLKTDELAKFEDVIFSQISPNLKDSPNSPDLVSLFESFGRGFNSKNN